ncbi:hypothetical protein OTU49_013035, partial [Cherax quadricarinatus]
IAFVLTFVAIAAAYPADIINIELDHMDHEQEGVPGRAVKGEYSWVAPNGEEYRVEYIADHLGYRVLEDNVVPKGPVGESLDAATFRAEADEGENVAEEVVESGLRGADGEGNVAEEEEEVGDPGLRTLDFDEEEHPSPRSAAEDLSSSRSAAEDLSSSRSAAEDLSSSRSTAEDLHLFGSIDNEKELEEPQASKLRSADNEELEEPQASKLRSADNEELEEPQASKLRSADNEELEEPQASKLRSADNEELEEPEASKLRSADNEEQELTNLRTADNEQEQD